MDHRIGRLPYRITVVAIHIVTLEAGRPTDGRCQTSEVNRPWNVWGLSSLRWGSMVAAPVCPCCIPCSLPIQLLESRDLVWSQVMNHVGHMEPPGILILAYVFLYRYINLLFTIGLGIAWSCEILMRIFVCLFWPIF